MAIELFKNNPTTSLNGAINNSVTSLVVGSASSFPTTGNFRIIIDSEIMIVTAVSGTTFTVTRGAESTTAASHSDTVTITGILTAGALAAFRADTVTSGAFASRPTVGVAGRIYEASDAPYLSYDNGSSWETYGPIWKMTPPVDASFSWVNQSSASVATANGAIYLSDPGGQGNADSWRLRVKAVPSAPYTLTVALTLQAWPVTTDFVGGLCLYDSGTGKIVTFVMGLSSRNWRVGAFHYTNTTSFSATLLQAIGISSMPTAMIWMRIEDNNTDRKFYYSYDGFHYILFSSESRTAFCTPDKIGFAIDNINSSSGQDGGITVYSYLEA